MMKVLELKDLPLNERSCVTVGGFDGIHLGHRVLLEEILREATIHKAKSVVVTFKIPPKVLLKRTPYGILMTLDEKIDEVAKYGIDYILLLDFEDVRNLTPKEFIEEIILKGLKACRLVMGFNHKFGRNSEGDTAFLARNLDKWGFALTIIPPVIIEGEVVSSTKIRKLVAEGNVRKASLLLGHPYRIVGEVIKGHGLGRKLGFPTANIKTHPQKVKPAKGVYAVIAILDGSEHKGVLNIGHRPTVSNKPSDMQIELHIPNYDGGELYGKPITIEFYERIRDECKFPSLQELKAQIRKDIEKAMEILNGHRDKDHTVDNCKGSQPDKVPTDSRT